MFSINGRNKLKQMQNLEKGNWELSFSDSRMKSAARKGKVFKAAPLLFPAEFMPRGEEVRAQSGNFGAAAL